MTATSSTDRLTIQCCGCEKKFTIPKDTASDLTILNISCPYCGINGALVKDCRR